MRNVLMIFHRCAASTTSTSAESQRVPPRSQILAHLKSGKEYDVLVVGGGSAGAGTALDAVTRGLTTACIEREDFASATSSRSTQLLWGGSRYLVQCLVELFNHDLRLLRKPVQTLQKFYADFNMVVNCHRERKFMMQQQSHLTNWIPIAVPFTNWIIWPPPYNYPPASIGPLGLFYIFFKFYDFLGGFHSPPSHIMTPKRALRKFPQLDISRMKYCSVFYEGQHNDARTNLSIALTAAIRGADIINYCNLVKFQYNNQGKINGAVIRDELTNEQFEIHCKSVVFCGGCFTDEVRKIEDASCQEAVTGASGVHIVLPSYYAPSNFGFVDMNTSDGRFLFFLPWQGHVLVGTTDTKARPTMRPEPSEAEIVWLLHEASKYLNPELQVRRKDVLSAWCGVRPLACDPHRLKVGVTSSVSRDHIVSHNPKTDSVFLAGGKWTTYREMAEDAVNKVISLPAFENKAFVPSKTLNIPLIGKEGFTPSLSIALVQTFNIQYTIAQHLAKSYAGRAYEICKIASEESNFCLLSNGYPYLEAEVTYAVRHEWAVHVADILARRTRLAFLNKEEAIAAVPKVVELMAKELKWNCQQIPKETFLAYEYLQYFGGPSPRASSQAESEDRIATVADLKLAFSQVDRDGDGLISHVDVLEVSEIIGRKLTAGELEDCISKCDQNNSGKIGQNTLIHWWNNEALSELDKLVKVDPLKLKGSGSAFG